MPVQATRRAAIAGAGAVAAVLASPSAARSVWSLDAFVERAMREFDIPGLALTLVQDGAAVHARGYGVRRLGDAARAPVDENTAFALASCTKAFTGAALGMLVEAGRLSWDDPVTRHLPGFAMSDPAVTGQITVRDLLLHRSGLGLGAGDLMTWPATTHSRSDIIAGLRHLPLARPFRAGYDYDNVLYIAAGEVIAAAAGESWEQFVRDRILQPLGMTDSGPTADPAWLPGANFAWPHARLDGPLRGLGAQTPLATSGRERTNNGPAGGVRSTARDIARWLLVQLGGGTPPGGPTLWTDATARELWRPRTLIRDEGGASALFPDMPVMVAYASGWEVRDFRGRKIVWHAGQLNGQSANIVLIPSRSAGFAILSNAEEGDALRALRNTLIDRILGHTEFDWMEDALARRDGRRGYMERQAATLARPPAARAPARPLADYAGIYGDPWYGAVTVAHALGALSISFDHTPRMHGPLEPWDGDVFRTRFPDRNFEDALVSFEIETDGGARMRLQPVSPFADFSYDYRDLALVRLES